MKHLFRILLIGLVAASSHAQSPQAYDLALVDLRGRLQVLGTLPGSVFAPRVSPDGRRVVFEAGTGPTQLWVADLAKLADRHALPMVGADRNWAAVWSNDGERVIFLVSGHEPAGLYQRRVDGSGEAEFVVDARAPEGVYDDDGSLMFITLTGQRDYGISLFDLRSKAISPLIDRPGSEQHSSRRSPDGRWVAYASNETGRQEVWLEPLPVTGKRFRVTQDGGSHPLWSPDGRTLYYDRGGQLFRIDTFLGAETPKTGEEKALPIRGFQQGDLRRQFDLLPDGRRFLMLIPRP
jgi:eukaryotic-like serine/threonine-protein kinase